MLLRQLTKGANWRDDQNQERKALLEQNVAMFRMLVFRINGSFI